MPPGEMSEAALAAVGARAPKTRRGKKILRDRESKVVEDAKTALILAGNKCSDEASKLLKDLHRIRTPLSVHFGRKHAEHPFEDIGRIETLCWKSGHSLFAFGSSSKKRPFRLIFGRLFDGKLLDMQEYNVDHYKPMNSFPSQKQESLLGSKPLMLFQGSGFETDEHLKRSKSLLMDFFKGDTADKVILQGLEQVVVCSTFDSGAGAGGTISGEAKRDDKTSGVFVRRFRVQMTKSGSRLPRVELAEVGPSFRLTLDRSRDPDKERWKMAIKVPKQAKPKKEKSIRHDTLGKKRGQVHLGKQDFDQIHTVHHSKLKSKKLKAELAANKRARTVDYESGDD